MMSLSDRLKSILLACGVFGLAACGSGPVVDPSTFDAEVQRLVDEGDKYGEVFIALKDRRPKLYSDFRAIALEEFVRGRSARDAGYVAGMRMRSIFIDEILSLSRGASDEHVKDMIDVMIATYEHLNTEDPADCVRNIDGLPLQKVTDFPYDLRQRETQLIIDLLNAPQTLANRRAASEKEVTNWMLNVSTLEPEVAEMLDLMAQEERGGETDAKICTGMITLYKRLSYKRDASRGTLFRGMALMALEQQQLQRIAQAEDAA
ncbi:MAG: hypothetical protein AAGA72_02535 [Pseudomonadota bacterium]